MNRMNTVVIDAKRFIDESASVIDSAMRIGLEALGPLRAGQDVIVSVRGVRGVSSSFFNVLLATVSSELGAGTGRSRLTVDTETRTQAMVWDRSKAAFDKDRASRGDRAA